MSSKLVGGSASQEAASRSLSDCLEDANKIPMLLVRFGVRLGSSFAQLASKPGSKSDEPVNGGGEDVGY